MSKISWCFLISCCHLVKGSTDPWDFWPHQATIALPELASNPSQSFRKAKIGSKVVELVERNRNYPPCAKDPNQAMRPKSKSSPPAQTLTGQTLLDGRYGRGRRCAIWKPDGSVGIFDWPAVWLPLDLIMDSSCLPHSSCCLHMRRIIMIGISSKIPAASNMLNILIILIILIFKKCIWCGLVLGHDAIWRT